MVVNIISMREDNVMKWLGMMATVEVWGACIQWVKRNRMVFRLYDMSGNVGNGCGTGLVVITHGLCTDPHGLQLVLSRFTVGNMWGRYSKSSAPRIELLRPDGQRCLGSVSYVL